MNMMVKQVAKARHEPLLLRRFVVRAEDCGKRRVVRECRADPRERIGVHFDIGIHEEEEVTGCLASAFVSCRGRPGL